jgi:krueppel-like factor 4
VRSEGGSDCRKVQQLNVEQQVTVAELKVESAVSGQDDTGADLFAVGRQATSHPVAMEPPNFLCPVPGCGSTFTRHFNLKGMSIHLRSGPLLLILRTLAHLRSHNDEKPFLCKWPGCGKGFSRQHDCVRHEQLHSNHRPFICEGCKKPFARLDALNRHCALYLTSCARPRRSDQTSFQCFLRVDPTV